MGILPLRKAKFTVVRLQMHGLIVKIHAYASLPQLTHNLPLRFRAGSGFQPHDVKVKSRTVFRAYSRQLQRQV